VPEYSIGTTGLHLKPCSLTDPKETNQPEVPLASEAAWPLSASRLEGDRVRPCLAGFSGRVAASENDSSWRWAGFNFLFPKTSVATDALRLRITAYGAGIIGASILVAIIPITRKRFCVLAYKT